ncbi:MAG: tRNA uridine(34) 5-carboxymethylaminomethyl modification radical SAM/GNAT enzyme Elp3 [Candidatus Hadarchaeales archaeon]
MIKIIGTMEDLRDACKEILKAMSAGKIKDRAELARAKIEACRKFSLTRVPRNSEILAAAGHEERKAIAGLLRLKPVRSISGVSVITVMPRPHPCPKERPCIYCPGGPTQGTPQSYTGREPAAMRALQHNFDPYLQVRSRIEQLRAIGHEVDKVELVVFGGTITAYPEDYLEEFMLGCLNAITGSRSGDLEEAMRTAEGSRIHISDITFETRPDWCREPHVDLMLRLGATRVELGVQALDDEIYVRIGRGHTVNDVADAMRIARDSGLAIVAHMMLNLPGSSWQRDLYMFRTLFEDERFRPDAIKIYPTLVMPNTELHGMWGRGEYSPYPLEQLVELIAEIKAMTPPWVRIQRIQRDIPAHLIAGGIRRGDLREIVRKKLRESGRRCRCIRCREVGHVRYREGVTPGEENIELVERRYSASGGEEIFLSFEDIERDIIIALLRLRYPSQGAHRREISSERTTVVRELHVYGPLVKVGDEAGNEAWQHRGWGERLLQEAERISRECLDASKVAVLAGIGTRNYYRRSGYRREGPYMTKKLVPARAG